MYMCMCVYLSALLSIFWFASLYLSAVSLPLSLRHFWVTMQKNVIS